MSSNVQIQYVGADMGDSDPLFEQFKGIFEKFARPEELLQDASGEDEDAAKEAAEAAEKEKEGSTALTLPEEKKLSKKKKKLLSRLTVAQLKQLVPRPDVVEAHDVTSHDPRFLVYLKSYRNTVPVPRHWCHKRVYLAGKRGIERPPFLLPEFIAETGIAKIRESVLEAEAAKKASQKARDKLQVKMGRIEIDYQVLHDAFFKYQTKPHMTPQGDIYYEGKEFELDLKEKKPGVFSPELVEALGMSLDEQGEAVTPPPWLINMQRYGPPPSYPNLRIPGLNAPLPNADCQYGYHSGGWGKPPVDEYGRPIYGDVFGVMGQEGGADADAAAVDKTTRWGVLQEAPAGADDDDDDDDDEEEGDVGEGDDSRRPGRGGAGSAAGDVDQSGLETPSTVDGISSVATGLETPDGSFDLRKRTAAGIETPLDAAAAPYKELYHVVKETSSSSGTGAALFGSDRTYVLPGAAGAAGVGKGEVAVSVNPDVAENPDQLRALYDAEAAAAAAAGRSEGAELGAEDALGEAESDPRNKRKRRAEATVNSKRHRDFKF